MKIYVASSWRNERQPEAVEALRFDGHEVYDFRNPGGEDHGFSWAQIDGRPHHVAEKGHDWVAAEDYQAMVAHPIAQAGFQSDFAAMMWADAFVMLLPCGKSAHLELGWAAGMGKATAIVLEDPVEPELMYLCADFMAADMELVRGWALALGRKDVAL